MKRIIRLTESDLARIVRRVIKEGNDATYTGSKEGDIKYFQTPGSITAVQNILGMWSDGKWGSQTKECIKFFQGKMGVGVDGVVGPDTANALWNQSRKGGGFVQTYQKSSNAYDKKMANYCMSDPNKPSQTGSRY
jgi:peptidoglycan hydrolase-like protein with peptidoglycan-binding domain